MSTPVELQRAKEQQLAVTREALAKALVEIGVFGGTPDGAMSRARPFAERLLDSGALVDADEVRREAEQHIPEECTDSRCPVCRCVAGYEARNYKADAIAEMAAAAEPPEQRLDEVQR